MAFITDLVLAIEKDKDRHVNCPFSHDQAVADEKGAAFPLVRTTGTYGDVRLCTKYGSSGQKLVNLMWKTDGPCPSDHVQVPYHTGAVPDNIVGKEGRVCAKWIREGDPGYDAADAIACVKKVVPADGACKSTEWTPCTSSRWDSIKWGKHDMMCLARASGVTAMNTGEVLATAPRSGGGAAEEDEEDSTNLIILAIVSVAMCVLVCIACTFAVSMTL